MPAGKIAKNRCAWCFVGEIYDGNVDDSYFDSTSPELAEERMRKELAEDHEQVDENNDNSDGYNEIVILQVVKRFRVTRSGIKIEET